MTDAGLFVREADPHDGRRIFIALAEGACDALARYFEARSEEHTSELQSLMRISYAVFCLKKKNKHNYSKSNNKHKIILTFTQYTRAKTQPDIFSIHSYKHHSPII